MMYFMRPQKPPAIPNLRLARVYEYLQTKKDSLAADFADYPTGQKDLVSDSNLLLLSKKENRS